MDQKLKHKGKVCVTGASGFLASWLVKRLLLSGYFVIGTVRDPGDDQKVEHLWRLEGAKERLKLVKADLMEEGSFDEAIMGCDGVFHTASPLVRVKSDPKVEILGPAVEGTLNVLRSCKKNPSLRRVVVTSSSTTIRSRDDIDPKVPLDESSWGSVERCERLKRNDILVHVNYFQATVYLLHKAWYPLSKILAERAAWEFCKENNIDLVTVIPAYIIGPSLPFTLCKTASDVLGLFKGEKGIFEFIGRSGYIHIDDAALCHILVYEHESANGRYVCSSTVMNIDELGSFLAARYPSYPIPTRFKKTDMPQYEHNTAKIKSLGIKFKPIEEMFDDCVASFQEQGHL